MGISPVCIGGHDCVYFQYQLGASEGDAPEADPCQRRDVFPMGNVGPPNWLALLPLVANIGLTVGATLDS
jgi:hypothetical protein